MNIIQATIITVGDELLIGQTIDTNSAWMAHQLNALGIEVQRRIAVGDLAAEIGQALDDALARTPIVLLTGGLGPTSDDITKPFLCQYFGGQMIVHEAVLAHITDLFEQRGKPMLEANRRQAEVPDVCTVLFNRAGTAPGMWFDAEGGKVVVALPGVPFEMMALMEDEVLPRLRRQFVSDSLVHRTIITSGEGESFVASRIADLEAALPPHIKLAYLPQPGLLRLRLTGRGADQLALIREVELRRDELAGRLEELVVALEDLPMEHVLGKLLTVRGLTLGLAESCTGGYVAHQITQIMGAAGYFMGSIVCYQEHVKTGVLGVQPATIKACCVVSEEVALEMAQGARWTLKSDIGFGVTGLLSPGGEDRVPVGTVCMAVADAERQVAKTYTFRYDRILNKEMAMMMSLLMIWRFVEGKI